MISGRSFVDLTASTHVTATAMTGNIELKAEQDIIAETSSGALRLTSNSHAEIMVNHGALHMHARTDAKLHAETGMIEIEAGTQLNLASGTQAHIRAEHIVLDANQSLELRVGGTSIILTAGSIALESPAISSKAVGEHTISGALIRLN